MIGPDYVFVLRRVPRSEPIRIEDLERLVRSDVALEPGTARFALFGQWNSFKKALDDLVGSGFLRYGYDRRKGVGAAVMPQPSFVNLTDDGKM